MQIDILDLIDKDHMAHYWYGGLCAEIKYKGYTFSIHAIGDVYAEYYTEDDDCIDIRDKNNAGVFYEELSEYLENDADLYNAIERERLIFDANNWWECFVTDQDGYDHDIMWCLDAVRLDDAIDEVVSSMDDIIEQIKE